MRRAGLYTDDRDRWGPDDPVFPSPWFNQANSRTAGYLGLEHKFFDTSFDRTQFPIFSGYPTNGNLACVTTIGQGPGYFQRNGRVCTLSSLSLKGILDAPGNVSYTAPPANSIVYLAIVLDTQTNGALALSQDVFTNILFNEVGPAHDGPPLQVASLHRNLLNEPRFRILAERVLDLGVPPVTYGPTGFAYAPSFLPFDIDIALDIPVSFTDSPDQSISNVVDNSVHVMAFALQGEGTYITWACRVRFYG